MKKTLLICSMLFGIAFAQTSKFAIQDQSVFTKVVNQLEIRAAELGLINDKVGILISLNFVDSVSVSQDKKRARSVSLFSESVVVNKTDLSALTLDGIKAWAVTRYGLTLK